MDIQHLNSSITWRYLLAVSLIAVLSTMAFLSLQAVLSGSQNTAYVVNISGKQRMLSQHIALDAHRLNKMHQTDSTASIKLQKKTMLNRISEMRLANKKLSSGLLDENTVISLSPEIAEMYFGKMNLFERVNAYLDLAQQFIEKDNQQTQQNTLAQIDQQSETILNDLNKIVTQYQVEGEANLERIEILELLVWVVTLITLGLEVRFIFMPMTKEVISSKLSEQETLDHLKDIVELRTLKLKEANEKLKALASLDPLTGLKNRLTLESDIESLLTAFHDHSIPFAVAIIDIDWFKHINDKYGHQAGDMILRQLADLLVNFTRESDKLYRTGGEEFLIILNRIDYTQVQDKLDALRNAINNHQFHYESFDIPVTISIGYYHSSLVEPEAFHQIYKLADNALYKAKAEGRNQTVSASLD